MKLSTFFLILGIGGLSVLWLGWDNVRGFGTWAGCSLPNAASDECAENRADDAAVQARVAAAVAEATLTRPVGSLTDVKVPLCMADQGVEAGWSEPVLTFGPGWQVTPAWSSTHLRRQYPINGRWTTVDDRARTSSLVRYCTKSAANADLFMPLEWDRT